MPPVRIDGELSEKQCRRTCAELDRRLRAGPAGRIGTWPLVLNIVALLG